jgi:hypothetical protein
VATAEHDQYIAGFRAKLDEPNVAEDERKLIMQILGA